MSPPITFTSTLLPATGVRQEALHNELNEARTAHARKSTAANNNRMVVQKSQAAMVQEEPEEADLSPMLKVHLRVCQEHAASPLERNARSDLWHAQAALDKLWQRPYDCRVFTLQLLQSLAQLDNASLCMMSSCFARYLENHTVPA